jgi:hypothetical protein
MSSIAVISKISSPSIIDVPVKSFIELTSQHFECSKCSSTSHALVAPTFKVTNIDGVSEFTFAPMSDYELRKMALFFGVAHTYTTPVVFNLVPGFENSAKVSVDNSVSVVFNADDQLLYFMGLNESLSTLRTITSLSQLEALEASLISASKPCKK